jgi:hemoglobin
MTDDAATLYNRIGGRSGIVILVDSFYQKVLGDDSLRDFFLGVQMGHLKKMQEEFFSIALGGPSEYSDIELAHAHHGKDINARHFDRFVSIFFSVLEELDMSEDERYQVISQINTYVNDIVGEPESLI